MKARRPLVPDFLGIGAMRCGTTWLVRMLRTHPEVWMSRRKEVHFFDRRIDEGRLPFLPAWESRIRYSAFFVEGRLRGRNLAGEVTPEYALLPRDRIELVHRWMPELKILFLMRDPVERGWSHIRKDASEPVRALSAEPSVDDMLRFLDHPNVRPRGDYASSIRHWQEFFPADRFCHVFLEEIEHDPGGTLRHILRFLGADPSHEFDPALLTTPQNARADDGMPDRVRQHLIDQFAGDVPELERLIGREVPWR